MIIVNCEQGSPEWFSARAGIPTASMYQTVMAKSRDDADSKTRRTYMLKLIGEKMTGEPMESFNNAHMERGKVMEEEARNAYAFLRDMEPKLVGFIRNGDTGASPDSLIGENGLLEIKTKLPHLQLEVLLSDVLPMKHRAQVQGQLWVAEREFCDFVSYWPKLPLFVTRVFRDEPYIKTIEVAVSQFNDEMSELMARVQQLRAA
ncbi:MAG: lambda exonuclease family protein [Sulfuricaulis sp.]